MKEQEGKIVKKIAKKNQIVIATLAVMIAAAGYMNYSGEDCFPRRPVYTAVICTAGITVCAASISILTFNIPR